MPPAALRRQGSRFAPGASSAADKSTGKSRVIIVDSTGKDGSSPRGPPMEMMSWRRASGANLLAGIPQMIRRRSSGVSRESQHSSGQSGESPKPTSSTVPAVSKGPRSGATERSSDAKTISWRRSQKVSFVANGAELQQEGSAGGTNDDVRRTSGVESQSHNDAMSSSASRDSERRPSSSVINVWTMTKSSRAIGRFRRMSTNAKSRSKRGDDGLVEDILKDYLESAAQAEVGEAKWGAVRPRDSSETAIFNPQFETMVRRRLTSIRATPSATSKKKAAAEKEHGEARLSYLNRDWNAARPSTAPSPPPAPATLSNSSLQRNSTSEVEARESAASAPPSRPSRPLRPLQQSNLLTSGLSGLRRRSSNGFIGRANTPSRAERLHRGDSGGGASVGAGGRGAWLGFEEAEHGPRRGPRTPTSPTVPQARGFRGAGAGALPRINPGPSKAQQLLMQLEALEAGSFVSLAMAAIFGVRLRRATALALRRKHSRQAAFAANGSPTKGRGVQPRQNSQMSTRNPAQNGPQPPSRNTPHQSLLPPTLNSPSPPGRLRSARPRAQTPTHSPTKHTHSSPPHKTVARLKPIEALPDVVVRAATPNSGQSRSACASRQGTSASCTGDVHGACVGAHDSACLSTTSLDLAALRDAHADGRAHYRFPQHTHAGASKVHTGAVH